MFYKINPVHGKVSFDLAADGFRVRDRLWIDLRGDSQKRAWAMQCWKSIEIGDDRIEVAAQRRVEAAGRLVEKKDARVPEQGLGEAEALAHPLGVGADGRSAAPSRPTASKAGSRRRR